MTLHKNICVLLLLLLTCSFNCAKGQYFFQDILKTISSNEEFHTLQTSKLKLIKISSFDENDKPSEGFFCEKKFNGSYTESQMVSRSYITGESEIKSFYNPQTGIIKTVNRTPSSVNTTIHEYNTNQEVASITTISTSANGKDSISETRQYFYENHQPKKMIRKKNGSTVAVYEFITDKNGNVIEEKPVEGAGVKYYYYYNDANKLTDVVRFNQIAQKLLPDYMFQYSKGGKPSQMISVDESARNYYIWRYAYEANGLPEIEKCYSKEKRLLGTIQYDYQ